MTSAEFVDAIKAMGFEADEDGETFTKGTHPLYYVNVDESGAWSSYNYGGDTGPIELTDPERAPFDHALKVLKSTLESGW